MNINNHHKTLQLLILLLALSLFVACAKYERNNPWDEKAEPKDWAPHNVEYVINSETSITISWDYTAILPEGFKIDRKAGDANWEIEYSILDNDKLSFTDNFVNLIENQYQYRVYAYAGDKTSTYTETDFTNTIVFDIDGNVYQTVMIGNQRWMAENLRVTRYNNADDIPTGLSNADWSNTTSGAYAIYDHNAWNTNGINSPEEMVAAYGKLYNWYAVDDTRGLCPEGWSVPSDAQWTELVNYVVSQGFPNHSNNPNGASNALKSCRQFNSPLGGSCNTSEHPRWIGNNTHHGFDEFGFSSLPSGNRWQNGSFSNISLRSNFWIATELSETIAWRRIVSSSFGDVRRNSNSKRDGFSVRCIKDIE